MQELTEFLKAGTEFFKTATVYLNMKATADKLIEAPKTPAAAPKAVKERKIIGADKPSAPATRPPKTVEEALGTDAPGMSEKESLDTAQKLATRYLSEGNKDERKAELIAHIKSVYGKGPSISNLTHVERMEFIEHLKSLVASEAAVETSL